MIQGSRLGGVLYSIYQNEMPEICRIMKDKDMLRKMTNNPEAEEMEKDHKHIHT